MSWHRCRKKTTVEACNSISTTLLKRYGFLHNGYICEMPWRNAQGEEVGSVGFWISLKDWTGDIRLQYAQVSRGGDNEILDYSVNLVATPCNYGSKRWWFVCPLDKKGIACNRRVRELYLGDGKYFGCRHCYNLTYTSVQKHDQRVDDLIRDPERFIRAPISLDETLLILKAMIKLWEKEKKYRSRNNCRN